MRPILILALAIALLAPLVRPAAAQERSWSISVFTEAGGLIPIRSLGKNVGNFEQLDDQQVLSDLENATTLGGGLELLLPGPGIRIRAMYNTTTGGQVVGRIAFCGDPSNPLVTGPICEPFSTDAKVQSFSADVGFLRGNPGSRFRPVIFLGLGLRKYDLGEVDCPAPDPVDFRWRSCELLEELWLEEGGVTPTLRLGAGLDIDLGPIEIRTSAMDIVGRYPGGTGTADGHGQNDIALSAGLSVKVF